MAREGSGGLYGHLRSADEHDDAERAGAPTQPARPAPAPAPRTPEPATTNNEKAPRRPRRARTILGIVLVVALGVAAILLTRSPGSPRPELGQAGSGPSVQSPLDPAATAGPGFDTTAYGFALQDPRARLRSEYTVRVVDSAHKSQILGELGGALDDMNADLGTGKLRLDTGAHPTQLPDSELTGLIEIRVDAIPPDCAGQERDAYVLGCASLRAEDDGAGALEIVSGRIVLAPELFTQDWADSNAVVYATVLHEIGHILNLGHFDGLFRANPQVMAATGDQSDALRLGEGDRNGLRYIGDSDLEPFPPEEPLSPSFVTICETQQSC